MTTKPKARKFRIKRNPTPSGGYGTDTAAAPPTAAKPAPEDAPPAGPHPVPTPKENVAPTAQTGEVSSAREVGGELDMDAIRREGLTGRQLRMARRVAQKYGLAPTSDFDAVRLLRIKGIDPFQRSNMLELVVPQAGGKTDGGPNDTRASLPATDGRGAQQGRVQLPQTVPAGGGVQLPSTDVSPAQRRQREISEIQRDITRRRQKKMGLLLVRLAFFVLLPTLAAGFYFYRVATPMYATNSQFLIIQSEGGGGASPFSGLLPTQFATGQDSIATQAYLQSKDAMLRLDGDSNFKDHFSDSNIDAIQRLESDPTNEQAYKLYQKNVKIGFDPTEGVIRMEVIAADPELSAAFSRNLIDYAEERVNNLSKQKREDTMQGASEGFDQALQKRRDVQQRLIELQVKNGVDPQAEIISIRTQITTYEGLLIEKQLTLAALLDNTRPNKAKVDGAQGDVRRLQEQLDKMNLRLNSATQGEDSLAQKAVEMQLAQADLAAADLVLQAAQTAMDGARTEASRQVRYLTVAVRPVAPEEPTYPRKFENTILAFLIFAGIYLMLSLTASILREQVTS